MHQHCVRHNLTCAQTSRAPKKPQNSLALAGACANFGPQKRDFWAHLYSRGGVAPRPASADCRKVQLLPFPLFTANRSFNRARGRRAVQRYAMRCWKQGRAAQRSKQACSPGGGDGGITQCWTHAWESQPSAHCVFVSYNIPHSACLCLSSAKRSTHPEGRRTPAIACQHYAPAPTLLSNPSGKSEWYGDMRLVTSLNSFKD